MLQIAQSEDVSCQALLQIIGVEKCPYGLHACSSYEDLKKGATLFQSCNVLLSLYYIMVMFVALILYYLVSHPASVSSHCLLIFFLTEISLEVYSFSVRYVCIKCLESWFVANMHSFAVVRGEIARRTFQFLMKRLMAVVIIQKYVRRWIARTKFFNQKEDIIHLQAGNTIICGRTL